MKPVTCYVGLGSNLDEPVTHVRSALTQLAAVEGVQVVSVSRLYSSKPMGPPDQADYVNAVACLSTTLAAPAVLQALFMVEHLHGRVRNESLRWGPRTLDLDLLLYGDEVIATEDLNVPHPGICERSFVVLPLVELAPDLILPDGRNLQDCLQVLSCDDLYPLV